jgi:hypothetical protein
MEKIQSSYEKLTTESDKKICISMIKHLIDNHPQLIIPMSPVAKSPLCWAIDILNSDLVNNIVTNIKKIPSDVFKEVPYKIDPYDQLAQNNMVDITHLEHYTHSINNYFKKGIMKIIEKKYNALSNQKNKDNLIDITKILITNYPQLKKDLTNEEIKNKLKYKKRRVKLVALRALTRQISQLVIPVAVVGACFIAYAWHQVLLTSPLALSTLVVYSGIVVVELYLVLYEQFYIVEERTRTLLLVKAVECSAFALALALTPHMSLSIVLFLVLVIQAGVKINGQGKKGC